VRQLLELLDLLLLDGLNLIAQTRGLERFVDSGTNDDDEGDGDKGFLKSHPLIMNFDSGASASD